MPDIARALSRSEALDMLAECFNEVPASLTPARPREDIVGWDSMGALMLIAELDERYGLELTAEDSRAMRSVADALDFLKRHGVLAA
jgi:acyl carrier protein